MALTPPYSPVDVNALMADLQARVRDELRARLLQAGGAVEFSDREVFEVVERLFRRALDPQLRSALLLPELMSEEEDWRLQTALRLSSHRPVVGPLILFVKRRILLPLTRWLYEYNLDNVKRQQRLNEILFASLQTLAIEHARLRLELAAGGDRRASRPPPSDCGPGAGGPSS